jgi:hypothetical protein
VRKPSHLPHVTPTRRSWRVLARMVTAAWAFLAGLVLLGHGLVAETSPCAALAVIGGTGLALVGLALALDD